MEETAPLGKILLNAFEQAPAFIQDFIRSGAFVQFLERLEQELSVDETVRSRVSNELLMVVLGITSPNELPSNLINKAGLPENLVSFVVEEAREGVFEPLIARGGGEPAHDLPAIISSEPPRAQPPPAHGTASVPPAQTQTPVSTPSPLSTFHENLPTNIPTEQSAPVPPPTPPTPIPTIKTLDTQKPTAPAEEPHARTMAGDIEAMQHGETAPPQVGRTSAPPPKPSTEQHSQNPAPLKTPPAVEAPPISTLNADLKKYGIDPYREPIE